MKSKRLLHIKFISICLLCIIPLTIFGRQKEDNTHIEKKCGILIISSYNPDIRRMSSFISDFEREIISTGTNYEIFIEDMNFKGIEESVFWEARFKKILEKNKENNIKAIVLLGQESWATYLSINEHDSKIPFFGSIASENGVDIGDEAIPQYPQSVDFIKKAQSMGYVGGALNRYNFKKNFKLIKSIYQNVQNIALLTDNTYGGISLQSLFIEEIKKESKLTYILLDARDGIDAVKSKISTLPENTIILLGTWRTGNKGQYLMNSSLEKILSETNKPVFTISGVGFGTLAVGGAIPVYNSHAKDIAKQIVDFYNGDTTAVRLIESETEYHFDKSKLDKYGIKNYQLPNNSVITDNIENQLIAYKQYLYAGTIALIILIFITIYISFLYLKNKKLKDKLKIRGLQLVRAKEKAEESDALKTAFLANMSHEIRTPLNAIVGFSTIICEEDTNTEERETYTSIIKSNSEILLTLINDILDISRLQANIPFNNEDIDIIQLMQEVILTTNHRNTLGLEISLDTKYDTFILNVDRNRLSQVLINLMTNAYKVTKKGSITMGFKVDNKSCIFSVADTGIGIPLDLQKAVFERFEKLNDFAQGTGLGLAICQQIVTKYGGTIYVDPTYTNGARFIFTIPIRQAK